MHVEIERISQILVNNNFPIQLVDSTIANFLANKFDQQFLVPEDKKNIVLYYRNQFNSQSSFEEKRIKKVISRSVTPVDPAKMIELRIYYRNIKLRNLLIKNKMHRNNVDSRVVYQYTCPEASCNASSYVGYTTCTVAQRFYAHAQSGAIRLHNKNIHSTKPLTRELMKSTTVIYRGSTKQSLTIAESLLIKEKRPTLNLQDEGFCRVLAIF
jgi:hypothetical protein